MNAADTKAGTDAVLTPSALETGFFPRFRAWLLGYDVFISYKRLDGLGYALALENLLRAHDYACFRDYREIPAGAEFPALITRALRRSRQLLVIGSPLAVDETEGAWVRREIRTFLEKRSRVIVVNVGESVKPDTWPELQHKSWIEENRERLQPPLPSAHVLDQILGERRFVKVNAIARWTLALTVLVILALAIAGSWYYYTSIRTAESLRAQELAASANALRESQPWAIAQSTRLALDAVHTHRNVLTEQSLRDAMAVLVPLEAEIQTSCDPKMSDLDVSRRYLVVAGDSKICLVDLLDRNVIADWKLPEDHFLAGITVLDDASILVGTYQLGQTSHLLHYSKASTSPLWDMKLESAMAHLARSAGSEWLGIGFDNGTFAIAPLRAGERPVLGPALECPGMQAVSSIGFEVRSGLVFCGNKQGAGLWRLGAKPSLEWKAVLGKDDLPTLADAPPAVFDPALQRLAVGFGNAVRIIDLGTFAEKQSMPLVDVDALGINARGMLVAHARGGEFAAWADVRSRYQRVALAGSLPAGGLPFDNRIGLSNDGNYLVALQSRPSATASSASLIQIASGDEVARLTHETYIRTFRSLGDGSSAITAAADGRIRFWGDLPARASQTNHGLEVVSAASIGSGGSATLVAGLPYGFGPQTIERWQLAPPKRIAGVTAPGFVAAIGGTTSIDGRFDFVVRNTWWSWNGTASKLEQVASVAANQHCGNASSVARDVAVVAISAEGNEIWLGEDQKLRRLPIEIRPRCVKALRLSPDGRYLAASYSDRTGEVLIADVKDPTRAVRFETQYLVRSLAFAPDPGLFVMAVGVKPASPTENPRNGFEIRSLPDAGLRLARELPGEGIFETACVSDDGSLIATSSLGSVDVWDYDVAANALALRTTVRMPASTEFCRFSREGNRLVLGTRFGLRTVILDPDELKQEALIRIGAPDAARAERAERR